MSLNLLETARMRRRTALLSAKSREALVDLTRLRRPANIAKPIFRTSRVLSPDEAAA